MPEAEAVRVLVLVRKMVLLLPLSFPLQLDWRSKQLVKMLEKAADNALGTPMAEDDAGPSRPHRRPNATILRTLTFTQNVSAAVFSIFVPMHLASPLLAAVGGLGAANKTMVSFN